MKQILLILIGLSITIQADDFSRDDSTNIVTDSLTNLQWQDDEEAKTVEKDWQSAIDYCEALELGGKDDWRLPNYTELKSIVDRGSFNPAIYSSFQNIASNNYWSSTTNASISSFAWVVNFDYGYDYYNDKSYSYFVRCVRAGL
jgi:hypothetical protein